jgi:periplasmic divalent cation tolerance protein
LTDILLVTTTVAERADADRLARLLVEQRLAACAQIERIDSVYHWQGALQQSAEWRVLFKTTEAHYAALEAALLDAHPYELPAVVAVQAHTVSVAYAQWVHTACRPPEGR